MIKGEKGEIVKYRKLGRTALMVSEIGMGSEGLVGKNERQAAELLSCALDHGVNYFDMYNSDPAVHRNLGRALRERRGEVFIQGHLCTAWRNEQYMRTRDIDITVDAFENLMRNINTDYIDVGMIHCVDGQADYAKVFEGEIIEYAHRLKKEGKIRYIGLSSHNPVTARRAAERGDIDVILFSMNPAYDMVPPSENLELLWAEESYAKPLHNFDPEREGFYELCARLDIGITVMKAFGGGDLLDAKLSPFGVAMTPEQCIHYALTRPGVGTVLCGFHRPEEVKAAMKYCEVSEAERDYAHVLSNLPKHSFAGRCIYCGHCAPCPVKIDVAAVNKYLNLALAQGFVPETVAMHYGALEHKASDCIECGSCERNCPFGVNVIERMRLAKGIFGETED